MKRAKRHYTAVIYPQRLAKTVCDQSYNTDADKGLLSAEVSQKKYCENGVMWHYTSI